MSCRGISSLRSKSLISVVLLNKMKTKFFLILSTITVGYLIWIFPNLGRHCTSGGNNTAINNCGYFVNLLIHEDYENKDSILNYDNADSYTKESIISRLSTHWTSKTEYFRFKKPIKRSTDPKEIIIYSDYPYQTEVHKYFPMSLAKHSVGYSDGSAAVISVKEFNKIDKRKYIKIKKVEP